MKFISGGREFECPVHVCTGYRATGMRLDERDLDDLARMNPVQLVNTVRQLANRTKHRQPNDSLMKITIRYIRDACIPMASAKQFFIAQGWDWQDFLANGREVSGDEFRRLIEEPLIQPDDEVRPLNKADLVQAIRGVPPEFL